jgi:hypothetical protein
MKRISLRLPEELHEQLKASAEHNLRSLHAEILWRINAEASAFAAGRKQEQAATATEDQA